MTTLRVPVGTSAALPKGAHRALFARCAKVGYSEPVFPDGEGDRGNYCVPERCSESY